MNNWFTYLFQKKKQIVTLFTEKFYQTLSIFMKPILWIAALHTISYLKAGYKALWERLINIRKNEGKVSCKGTVKHA